MFEHKVAVLMVSAPFLNPPLQKRNFEPPLVDSFRVKSGGHPSIKFGHAAFLIIALFSNPDATGLQPQHMCEHHVAVVKVS